MLKVGGRRFFYNNHFFDAPRWMTRSLGRVITEYSNLYHKIGQLVLSLSPNIEVSKVREIDLLKICRKVLLEEETIPRETTEEFYTKANDVRLRRNKAIHTYFAPYYQYKNLPSRSPEKIILKKLVSDINIVRDLVRKLDSLRVRRNNASL